MPAEQPGWCRGGRAGRWRACSSAPALTEGSGPGGRRGRAVASTLGCLFPGLRAHSLPCSWASFPSRPSRSLLVDLILYQAVLTRLEICVIHAICVDELLILRSLLLRLCCFALRRGVLQHLGDVLLSGPGTGQPRGGERAETHVSLENFSRKQSTTH